jgi:uncharacterized protein
MTAESKFIVTQRPAASRFEIQLGEHLAVLEYLLQSDTVIFTHTGVPSAMEGQGVGSQLVRAGLEFAREKALKVVPLCWFVAGYIQRHPEYQDLLK